MRIIFMNFLAADTRRLFADNILLPLQACPVKHTVCFAGVAEAKFLRLSASVERAK